MSITQKPVIIKAPEVLPGMIVRHIVQHDPHPLNPEGGQSVHAYTAESVECVHTGCTWITKAGAGDALSVPDDTDVEVLYCPTYAGWILRELGYL